MKITFEQIGEQRILVKSGDKVIGHIFSPAGTGEDMPSAIQVCGFDDAFDLWGCGIFYDDKGNPKKDIALHYNQNSNKNTLHTANSCDRCYYPKNNCKCSELRIKNRKDLILDALEEFN